MIAADRAMYQAKSLGKNQISGNPRPRRTGPRQLLPAPGEGSQSIPVMAAPAREAPVASAPAVDASAVEAPAVEAPARIEPHARIEPQATNGAARDLHGEDEPDPVDVRRQIAASRRNMDSDRQIRRAMDAFLSSPSARPGEIE
jgi:hypothetical protein